MKKLIILLLAMFAVSCATTQQLDRYPRMTVENVKNDCQVEENWNVAVLGMPALVLRFDNCINLKMLLVVASDNEVLTEEIRRSSMELLSKHYVEYLKRTDASEERKRNWIIEKVKEENSEGWTTYFFKITYKEVDCTDSACKETE